MPSSPIRGGRSRSLMSQNGGFQSAKQRSWTGRVPAFIPASVVQDIPHLVLAAALHRDAGGLPRPDCSAAHLASALAKRTVACDALCVRWVPPSKDTHVAMRTAWQARLGHEGDEHRQLRGVGLVLLVACTGNHDITPELTTYIGGRCIRSDFAVLGADGRLIVVEVGVVAGDKIHTFLTGAVRGPARRISHVAVLPFAGQGIRAAQGYVFRTSGTPPLIVPSASHLRATWSAVRKSLAASHQR